VYIWKEETKKAGSIAVGRITYGFVEVLQRLLALNEDR
jgi:hypothetical protein